MTAMVIKTETECANCGYLALCYDDGEAYICIDTAACRIRQLEVSLMGAIDRADAAHDALSEARSQIAELEARIAQYQRWLTEAHTEIKSLRRRLGLA